MTGYAFVTRPPALGLIVLQTDETIEGDFRRLFAPDVPLHVTRIAMGAELSAGNLTAMEHDIPAAASLLPRAAALSVVGYACTSAATLIGPDRVAELIRGETGAEAVFTPLDATIAACRAVSAGRIGLVSPYTADIAEQLQTAFEAGGIDIGHALHFGETQEANVARIAPASIRKAALATAHAAEGLEAIFLSCTNLMTLDIIEDLEAELGIPILSSNLCLAWAMARAAGVTMVGPEAALAAV